jgi:hypothetical protein
MSVKKVHGIFIRFIQISKRRLMKSNYFLRFFHLVTGLVIYNATFRSHLHISRTVAQTTIRPTWDVLFDDFESKTLDIWQLSLPNYPVLTPRTGYNGTTGILVAVNSDTISVYQSLPPIYSTFLPIGIKI